MPHQGSSSGSGSGHNSEENMEDEKLVALMKFVGDFVQDKGLYDFGQGNEKAPNGFLPL